MDNIDCLETTKPIVYKRRSKLLDEELDDTKDIITSESSTPFKLPELLQGHNAQTSNTETVSISKNSTEETESERKELPKPDICVNLFDNKEINSTVENIGQNTINLQNDMLLVDVTEKQQEQKQSVANKEELTDIKTDLIEIEKSKEVIYATVNKCPKNISESLSIVAARSEVIELHDDAILRRQQLNRVAEWVQNNTQQLEKQPKVINNSCSSHTPDALTIIDNNSASYCLLDNMDAVSIEKLSLDSGYKTTPQATIDATNKSTEDSLSPKTDTASLNNNIECNQRQFENSSVLTSYRRTTRSGLPVAVVDAEPNQNSEQPSCDILNYKYYPSENDKTHAVHAELHTTTQNVDIAQMEYNVKQFLLKQNEWSIHCNNNKLSSATTAHKSFTTSNQLKQQNANKPLKLFTSLSGPGMGERIRKAPGGAVFSTNNNNGNGILKMNKEYPTNTSSLALQSLPHRTETNL